MARGSLERSTMPAAESVGTAPSSPWRDTFLDPLLDLRGSVPFTASMLSIRRRRRGPDRGLHVYGMAREHVTYTVNMFIPRSAEFRAVEENPGEIYDWQRVPGFEESTAAREYLLRGYTQGVSLALMSDDAPVGSFHFNVSGPRLFTDAQFQAIDTARRGLQDSLRSIVRAGALALTPRELEVLHLLSHGATNGRIADLLTVSSRTVETHVERVLVKLGASNRAHAVRLGMEARLI